MNKFKFYSNGDPWCDAWRCLSCDTHDTYTDIINDETVIICYECKQSQKLSEIDLKEAYRRD